MGEKTTRTLEPVLATPISVLELLLGKALAAVIPAVGATWISFLIFLLSIEKTESVEIQFIIINPGVCH